jgi:acyl dehydratase
MPEPAWEAMTISKGLYIQRVEFSCGQVEIPTGKGSNYNIVILQYKIEMTYIIVGNKYGEALRQGVARQEEAVRAERGPRKGLENSPDLWYRSLKAPCERRNAMPVRSAAVGLSTEPRACEVTTRQLLAYAAGIGDTNARYFDDAAEAGILAHPMFIVAVEWPVALTLRQHPGFKIPREEGMRGVHAGQDVTFHRPIRPGDRLRTTATIVQVRHIRPGAFVLIRYETVDAASQEPVVTSYSSTIYRDVEVEGPDSGIAESPPLPASTLDETACQEVVVAVPREAPHVYTECADIWNPIHTERRVALAAGLPDIILHGTATYALAASQLINRCAAGDPTRLKRLAARFAAMVIPGTTITLRYQATPEAGETVPYTVCNTAGRPAIAGGVAVFR